MTILFVQYIKLMLFFPPYHMSYQLIERERKKGEKERGSPTNFPRNCAHDFDEVMFNGACVRKGPSWNRHTHGAATHGNKS
jgi:hypothetical protein